MSPEHGTHEVTRVSVIDGRARLGERGDGKVGAAVLEKVDWDPVRGLTLKTTLGYIWSPPGDCQVGYLVL